MSSKLQIYVNPNGYSGFNDLISCDIYANQTCLDVLHTVSNLIGIRSSSFVFVEMNSCESTERVLSYQDQPYKCMLNWTNECSFQFGIRKVEIDDIVLYANSENSQNSMEKKAMQYIELGLLPNMRLGEPDIDDLCMMTAVSQQSVLNVLKKRFLQDKIYTYSGDVLISVNPYKILKIYNPKFGNLYQNRSRQELNPHIYAVADEVLSNMMEKQEDQCIVITGKSGSGKTQATHFLVHHTLSLCHKSYMKGVETMLSGCGAVLEALGNASTEHNTNSSRFGKFLRVYFYQTGLLSGAEIRAYLLEKSRLVHQQANERNFHIFYYILYGMDKSELQSLKLEREKSYHYLYQNLPMDYTTAKNHLERLRSAMEGVGFFRGIQTKIFKLIAAILLLGNITFRPKVGREESLEIVDEECLVNLSDLLNLNSDDVCKCLLTRRARAGQGEKFILSLKHCEAKATRDAMAKALYRQLFDWIVSNMNMTLAQKTNDGKLRETSRSIGLLDIFGFEDFEQNSFEQFCINYASEHLQNYCLKRTFQLDQELYHSEGLEWKEIEYADNSGCIALYEQKLSGLFYLIDDKLTFAGATDSTLLDQYNSLHSNNPYYEQPRTREDAFIIKHFAGKVKYRITDFHEKNHDQVREDVVQLLRTSWSSFVQDVTSQSPAAMYRWGILRAFVRAVSAFQFAGSHPGMLSKLPLLWHIPGKNSPVMNSYEFVRRKLRARLTHRLVEPCNHQQFNPRRRHVVNGKAKRKVNSISQQYQASLASLMTALESANPFFVRCMQPNTAKIAGCIDDDLMLHQLRCSGTLQTITIQQTRFAAHYTCKEFYKKYKLLMKREPDDLNQIDDYLKSYLPSNLVEKDKQLYQIGIGKIFLHKPLCRYLRLNLRIKKVICVVKVQSYVRGFLERSRYVHMKKAAVLIQSIYRMYAVRKIYQPLLETEDDFENESTGTDDTVYMNENEAAIIIQTCWRNYKQQKLVDESIITIQKNWRAYKARQKYNKLKEKEKPSLMSKKSTMVDLFSRHTSSSSVELEVEESQQEVKTSLVDMFSSVSKDQKSCSAGDVFLNAVGSLSKKDSYIKPVNFTPNPLKLQSLLEKYCGKGLEDIDKNVDDEDKDISTDEDELVSVDDIKCSDDAFVAYSNLEKETASTSALSDSEFSQLSHLTGEDSLVEETLNEALASKAIPRIDNEIRNFICQYVAFHQAEYERKIKDLIQPKIKLKMSKRRQQKLYKEVKKIEMAQMSALYIKAGSLDIDIERIPLPNFESHYSRRNSSVTFSEPSTKDEESFPSSPLQSPKIKMIPRGEDDDSTNLQSTRSKSTSLESVAMFSRRSVPAENSPRSLPKRRRSNSAIETYAVQENQFQALKDPIEKKRIDEHQPQETPKKSRMGARLRNLLTYKHSQNPTTASDKPPTKKASGTPNSSTDNLSDTNNDNAMKVKSLEAENISVKVLITSNDELNFLDKFIADRAINFTDMNEVDSVFSNSIRCFRDILLDMFADSLQEHDGVKSCLRYKDIVVRFEQVLKTKAANVKNNRYAVVLGVNGFRGYLDEFVSIQEKKKKNKKEKEEKKIEVLGHRFLIRQWGVTQFCEYCSDTMYAMDTGYCCEVCQFVCHKSCVRKISSRCTCGKSGPPRKLIGEKLSSLVDSDRLVPLFLERACCYIEDQEVLSTSGIYRKSPPRPEVNKFIALLNRDYECNNIKFEDHKPHTVAYCIKNFLRQLPTPVCPFDIFVKFNQAAQLTDRSKRLASAWCTIESWPRENRCVFERMLFHFVRVSHFHTANRMTTYNMAVCFAPSLFVAPPFFKIQPNMSEMKPIIDVLAEIIKCREEIYNFQTDLPFTYDQVKQRLEDQLQHIKNSLNPIDLKDLQSSSDFSFKPHKARKDSSPQTYWSSSGQNLASATINSGPVACVLATGRARPRLLSKEFKSSTSYQQTFQNKNTFETSSSPWNSGSSDSPVTYQGVHRGYGSLSSNKRLSASIRKKMPSIGRRRSRPGN